MRAGHLFRYIQAATEANSALVAALQDAKAHGDPFVAFLFEERRGYRAACDNSTKSGKRVEEHIRLGYRRAQQYGFQGDLGAWRSLLNASVRES